MLDFQHKKKYARYFMATDYSSYPVWRNINGGFLTQYGPEIIEGYVRADEELQQTERGRALGTRFLTQAADLRFARRTFFTSLAITAVAIFSNYYSGSLAAKTLIVIGSMATGLTARNVYEASSRHDTTQEGIERGLREKNAVLKVLLDTFLEQERQCFFSLYCTATVAISAFCIGGAIPKYLLAYSLGDTVSSLVSTYDIVYNIRHYTNPDNLPFANDTTHADESS